MSTIDIIFLSIISVIIILMIISIFLLFKFFVVNTKIRKLEKKKKRRKVIKKLKFEKKKNFKWFIILMCLTFLLLCGNFFFRSYVSKMLLPDDRNEIIRAYFLIKDYTEDLTKVKNMDGERSMVEEDMGSISYKMSSFAITKPSDYISEEGQRLINRYFKSISELGINTANLNSQFYDNLELTDEYLANIEFIKQREKEVFTYFKLEESKIKEK